MCNHEPITIHEHGGETVICRRCMAVLHPWRARGEIGQAACVIPFVASLAVLLAGAVFILLNRFGIVPAYLGAVVAFLGVFWYGLRLLERCVRVRSRDGEVE